MDITVETKKKYTIVLDEQEMKDLMEMVKAYGTELKTDGAIFKRSSDYHAVMQSMYNLK